jgi:hypothetical protein
LMVIVVSVTAPQKKNERECRASNDATHEFRHVWV